MCLLLLILVSEFVSAFSFVEIVRKPQMSEAKTFTLQQRFVSCNKPTLAQRNERLGCFVFFVAVEDVTSGMFYTARKEPQIGIHPISYTVLYRTGANWLKLKKK